MDIIESRAFLLHCLTGGSRYPLGKVITDVLHEGLAQVDKTHQTWRVPPLSVCVCE